jgi:putative oxidoreductase
MTLKDRYLTLSRIGHKVASSLTWLPPLVARITLGVVFVQSGWGKLNNLEFAIDNFRKWGLPAPQIQAPFAAANELIFGCLLLIGFLTRFATIPLMIVMVVAMSVTAYNAQQAANEGTFNYLFGLMEYLYIVILLWLAIFGPGPVSVDRIVASKSAPQ